MSENLGPVQLFCGNCGSTLDEGNRFCRVCGGVWPTTGSPDSALSALAADTGLVEPREILSANLHRLLDLLATPDELPALPYISSDTVGGVLVNWFLRFNFDSLAEQRAAAAEIFRIIGGTWDQDEADEKQTRYSQAFEGLIPDEGLTLGVYVGGVHDGPVSTTSQETAEAMITGLHGLADLLAVADGLPLLPHVTSESGGLEAEWYLEDDFDSLAEQESVAAEIIRIIGGTWNQARRGRLGIGHSQDRDGLTLEVYVGGAVVAANPQPGGHRENLIANLHKLADLLAMADKLPALPCISYDPEFPDGLALRADWSLYDQFDDLAEQESVAGDLLGIGGGRWDQDEGDEQRIRYSQDYEGLTLNITVFDGGRRRSGFSTPRKGGEALITNLHKLADLLSTADALTTLPSVSSDFHGGVDASWFLKSDDFKGQAEQKAAAAEIFQVFGGTWKKTKILKPSLGYAQDLGGVTLDVFVDAEAEADTAPVRRSILQRLFRS